jgi:hypothetical protein
MFTSIPYKAVAVGAMLVAATAGLPSAYAAPGFTTHMTAEIGSQRRDVTSVDYRGRGGYGRGHGRGYGGVGILGGLLIGGVIVAAAVAEHRASGDSMRRCARGYPSFDPRSGTYVSRDGAVRVCPHLH